MYGDSSEDQNDHYGFRDSSLKNKTENEKYEEISDNTDISNSKKLSIS